MQFSFDVLPALDLLAKHYRLATLSNGNADLQRIGCAHRFEFNLTAGRIGVANPAAGAFETVLHLSGCAPQEVLYVGDDPEHDIAGPQRVGLRAA